MDIDYEAIGQRIRQYRQAKRLSQEMLSEKADVTPAHFSHIERGHTKPSLPTLIRIANVRVKDVDRLLEDCTPQEMKALTEILTAAKKALRTIVTESRSED